MALDNCVVVAQAKGGVGKTSVTANLAGQWAASGKRVLVCDFDPQGNLALDLGYEPTDGQALLGALLSGGEVPVIRDVRPNLDVIASGPNLGVYPRALAAEINPIAVMAERFELLLRAAGDYDLVLIDTAPGDGTIGAAAMAIASHVLAPAKSDDASVLGTVQLAERFSAVRSLNPTLQLAGVVLFDIGSTATRIERSIREQVDATLAGSSRVLMSRIRTADAAAVYGRRHGKLAYELAAAAADAERDRFKALREGRATEPVPSNAAALADDYRALADEVLAIVNGRQVVLA